jgi:hypothetical protein
MRAAGDHVAIINTTLRDGPASRDTPGALTANHRHHYAPFDPRTHRLRRSLVAALFPLKGMETGRAVLAELKVSVLALERAQPLRMREIHAAELPLVERQR